MKCEFCGSELGYESTECPHCGAPCQFIEYPKKNSIREDCFASSADVAKDDADNLRPMGSADLGFLKKNQDERRRLEELARRRMRRKAGCSIALFVITIIIIIRSCS